VPFRRITCRRIVRCTSCQGMDYWHY
jgi:hypothetical protein